MNSEYQNNKKENNEYGSESRRKVKSQEILTTLSLYDSFVFFWPLGSLHHYIYTIHTAKVTLVNTTQQTYIEKFTHIKIITSNKARPRKIQRQLRRETKLMAGLQRSEVSFRRQGSSGLVWDDKLLSGELNKNEDPKGAHGGDLNLNLNVRTTPPIQRSRSNGGYRTGKVSPAIEPPSPKLSACGFCSAFGKTGEKGRRAKPRAKHRSRQVFSGRRRCSSTCHVSTQFYRRVQGLSLSSYKEKQNCQLQLSVSLLSLCLRVLVCFSFFFCFCGRRYYDGLWWVGEFGCNYVCVYICWVNQEFWSLYKVKSPTRSIFHRFGIGAIWARDLVIKSIYIVIHQK